MSPAAPLLAVTSCRPPGLLLPPSPTRLAGCAGWLVSLISASRLTVTRGAALDLSHLSPVVASPPPW